jgi:nitrous oxidase accessory protein NosD
VRRIGAALVVLGCLAVAAPAQAMTIGVRASGPHPITDAIAFAKNGDTLAIHRGVYHEAVVVDKRLTLRAAGKHRPVIRAGCGPENAIDMTHAGVVLDHLKVRGGSSHTVNIANQPSGVIRDLHVRNVCDALYGINLSATGHVRVEGNNASDYLDSGVYVGEISDTAGGTLLISGNVLLQNDRGVIIEDSLGSTDIEVRHNFLEDNVGTSFDPAQLGAYVLNSDGVVFRHNQSDFNGQFGYFVDSNSDHNRFFDNTAAHNGTSAFHDEGTENCGSGNSFSILPC